MPIFRLPAHRTGPSRSATTEEMIVGGRMDVFAAPASLAQLSYSDREYQFGSPGRYIVPKIWGASIPANTPTELIHEPGAWVFVRKVFFPDAYSQTCRVHLGGNSWHSTGNDYFRQADLEPLDAGFLLPPGETCSVERQNAGTVIAFGGLYNA